MKTTVKVYLIDNEGKEDSFITPINLSENEAHNYYLNKFWNMGIDGDKMMKCYKVETLENYNS